jgi:hypothetical protein
MGMSDGEISLYFGLAKGQRADLEVIAEAALEWVASVRAAARDIDPNAHIRIELIDAVESSIRLNTVLEWLEAQLSRIDEGSGKYWRLRKVAIALAIFVPTVGYPTWDFYFGHDKFTVEDRKALHELLDQVKKNPEVGAHRQKFFNKVERDHSITVVGVSEGHGEKPMVEVPRDQFAERTGVWQILSDDEGSRTTYPVVDVILVSPVLIPTPRSWRFQTEGLPEFNATMKDRKFLAALEHDHVKERLRVGIKMTVRLEIKEKKVDGAWVVQRKGRSVIEVISPKVD